MNSIKAHDLTYLKKIFLRDNFMPTFKMIENHIVHIVRTKSLWILRLLHKY